MNVVISFQDEYMDGCTDGTWHERHYFTCPYGRAFFCPYYNLSPDRRFDAGGNTSGAAPAVNRKRQNLHYLSFVLCCGMLLLLIVTLLSCSPCWLPTGRASWPDNWAQPDYEVPGGSARDTGPPEFLLPGCNSVWTVCTLLWLWFHVPGRSEGSLWERDQWYSLEGHCEST